MRAQKHAHSLSLPMTKHARPDIESASALSSLISPLGVQEFLDRYWRKEFCHVQNPSMPFAKFLPWERLNRILEQHRLEPPRLRLARGGESVPADQFIDYVHHEGMRFPRVAVEKLNRAIKQGATVILNDVNLLDRTLGSLSEGLERFFGVPVGVNAYAGFGDIHGFNPHRDDHEVMIIQVSGKKRWKLHGFHDPPAFLGTVAPSKVIWDSVLSEGEFLYIPRGCWHVVIPQGKPSLHLTISISNPTLADVLEWFATELRDSELGNIDVSRIGSAAEQERFAALAKTEIGALLNRDFITDYFRDSDAHRRPLAHLSLPWITVAPDALPSGGARYRLSGQRKLDLHRSCKSNVLRFAWHGREWQYPSGIRSIVEALNDGESHSVEQLMAHSRGQLDESAVCTFLTMLLMEGLVFVESESSAYVRSSDSS
jgi:ribosomal protein L16 Arg81 hydroxylase